MDDIESQAGRAVKRTARMEQMENVALEEADVDSNSSLGNESLEEWW